MNTFKKTLLLGLLAISCNSAQAMFAAAFRAVMRTTPAVPVMGFITATSCKKIPLFEVKKDQTKNTSLPLTALYLAADKSSITIPKNDFNFFGYTSGIATYTAFREAQLKNDSKRKIKRVCTLAVANYFSGEFIGVDLGPDELADLMNHIDTLKHSAECECRELKEKIATVLTKRKKS